MPNQKKDNPNLSMIYDELLEIKLKVESNTVSIEWLKKLYQTISSRQWYIVAGIIISILLQLVFLGIRLWLG